MNCRTGRLGFIRLTGKILVHVMLISCHRAQAQFLPLPVKNWILLGIQYQFPRLQRLRSAWVTYVAYLWDFFFGVPPRGIPRSSTWSSLRCCFRGGTPAVGIWLPCRNGSIVNKFTPVANATRTSLKTACVRYASGSENQDRDL